MVMRVMLDTNVYDRMLHEAVVHERIQEAVSAGQIQIVETHIQENQLVNTGEEQRRALLLNTLKSTNADRAATAGFAWDLSRWDQSTLADEELVAFIDAILGNTKRGDAGHLYDALLVATAVREADVFVTEDGGLLNRARKAVERGKAPLKVMSVGALLEEIANGAHS